MTRGARCPCALVWGSRPSVAPGRSFRRFRRDALFGCGARERTARALKVGVIVRLALDAF